MNTLYLVDMILTEERSATVLVEALSEEEARELALIHTPENQYNTLDCESESRIAEVAPGKAVVSSEWGDYELARLVRIDKEGNVHAALRSAIDDIIP